MLNVFLPKIGRYFICALVALLVHIAGAQAAARTCTDDEAAAGNKALSLSSAQKEKATNMALPWGLPDSGFDGDELLVQRDYVTSYNAALRVPTWTAHHIVSKKLGKIDRINCFRADPRLLKKHEESSPADYREPIFDQGHMTPNGDMSSSTNAVVNSFLMSNMTPQYCHFNRGVWEMFEEIVRYWAEIHKDLYVITGAVFDQDEDGSRDDDGVAARMKSTNGNKRVAIPTHLYKILAYRANDTSVVTLAVMLPNSNKKITKPQTVKYLIDHLVTLADIKKVTGNQFFSGFGGTIHQEDKLTFWDTKDAKFSPLDSQCSP